MGYTYYIYKYKCRTDERREWEFGKYENPFKFSVDSILSYFAIMHWSQRAEEAYMHVLIEILISVCIDCEECEANGI